MKFSIKNRLVLLSAVVVLSLSSMVASASPIIYRNGGSDAKQAQQLEAEGYDHLTISIFGVPVYTLFGTAAQLFHLL